MILWRYIQPNISTAYLLYVSFRILSDKFKYILGVDLFGDITVISRRLSPVRGKGNSLLPVAICFYIRKFVPRSGGGGGGGKRAIIGYVWKNGPVQEDIYPSINIIDLTPLVYKNPTFYRSNFFKCSEKKVMDH